MPTLRTAVVACCLLVSSAVGADIPSVDPSVSDVAQGGFWRQGEEYGSCRVLVQNQGWEETRSAVFVQWLLTDDRRKTQTDRVTVPVKEMNEAEWMNVESVTYRDGAFRIVYTTWGSREIRREAILAPGQPGRYTIER